LYGQALGAAFQVVDDVLDYEGSAAELGKNLGDDLREGKMTLPLICTLQRCTASEAQLIRTAIEEGHTDQLDTISRIVRHSGGLDYARHCAESEAQRAIDVAKQLPQNPFSRSLIQLAEGLLERRS
jgi:octaprenyl-diphosphate synthase